MILDEQGRGMDTIHPLVRGPLPHNIHKRSWATINVSEDIRAARSKV